MLDPNKNKLEKLEQKVQQLEKKLESYSKKDDLIRTLETRLNNYESEIMSDKGEVKLKKNFVVKNRKAIEHTSLEGRINPDTDNSALFYFNNNEKGRLNHIFLGSASAEGFLNTSLLSTSLVIKDDIKKIKINGDMHENPSNGNFSVKLFHEKYLKKGMPDINSPDGGQPNIIVANRGTFEGQSGVEGVIAQLTGTGKNPYASIGTFVEDSITPSTFVACDKDNVYITGIPESDPGVPGAIWRDGTTLKISLG